MYHIVLNCALICVWIMVIEKFKKFCLHKKARVLISVITDKVMRVSQQYTQVSIPSNGYILAFNIILIV